MRWRKSLHVGLVIRYMVFFVVSMVALVATLLGFLGYFLQAMTSEEILKYTNSMTFNGTLDAGNLKIEGKGFTYEWIDFLKDGKVVASWGERAIEDTEFDIDEMNLLLASPFYGPSQYQYEVKVIAYPYTDDNMEQALVFRSINTGISIGINVPDEFKGTIVEKEMKDKLALAYAFVVLALVIVTLFFSLLTYRMIIKPIRALNAGLLAVKQGELSTRIAYKGYSELSELTESFNEMSTRLEKAENEAIALAESKKNMILHLSHDLRSPSTVVQGYAQALADGLVPEEKKPQYYNYIVEKSSLIVERIKQLFAYAKLDVQHYELSLETINVNEWLRRIAIGYLEEFESNNHTLVFDVPDELIWCDLDKVEMERAVGNLLENAIKYSGEGAEISVLLKKMDENQCRIEIADNGIGIGNPIDCFKPFVRGDQTRKTSGTGLGLAITKQIITLHQGRIECETLERGVQFSITLPTKK